MIGQRAEVRIPSHGEQLAAYRYTPDRAGASVPCVVMAHGLSATRDDGLPAYAEAFRDAGCAVILFDYRHFGASTGQPRQLLDIGRQQEDYRAVVDWARKSPGIDPDRIVLWGSSFSGGHVLVVAAADPRTAAVIAQAPFTDSLPAIRRIPLANLVRAGAAGLRDRLAAMLGRAPVLIPAVGAPGTFAVMTAPDADSGFRDLVGAESLWRNAIAARLVLELPFYRPVRVAARLQMPALFCVCDDDTITPPGSTITSAHRAAQGELRRYHYGHFDIYHDPAVKADQVEFLSRVLGEPNRLLPSVIH
ncbi:MAG: alpha/beta fold hydrolase [Mycobacterium sp.]